MPGLLREGSFVEPKAPGLDHCTQTADSREEVTHTHKYTQTHMVTNTHLTGNIFFLKKKLKTKKKTKFTPSLFFSNTA